MRIERERHPCFLRERVFESRRHDADHDVRRAVDPHRHADRTRIGAEVLSPHALGEHHDRVRAGREIGLRDAAPEQRCDARDRERGGIDLRERQRDRRATLDREIALRVAERAERFDRGELVAPAREVLRGLGFD